MSDFLPLFPLPNVVFFPNVFLPLHIFEPRYRQMTADAIAGDRMIGMVLLRPGWEHDYDGRPPIYPIGCSGLITHVDRLPDGRYNIVLRGIERFRVLREDDARPYRRGAVQPLADAAPDVEAREAIRRHRARLETLLAPAEAAGEMKIPADMSDHDLVNSLSQYLDLEPIEKQALLEAESLCRRAESLVELLEMKTLATKNAWTPNRGN